MKQLNGPFSVLLYPSPFEVTHAQTKMRLNVVLIDCFLVERCRLLVVGWNAISLLQQQT